MKVLHIVIFLVGFLFESITHADNHVANVSDADMRSRYDGFLKLCLEKADRTKVSSEVEITIDAILGYFASENLDASCQGVGALIDSKKVTRLSLAWHSGLSRRVTKLWPLKFFSESLRVLDVSGNPIVDFPILGDLPYLEHLLALDCDLEMANTFFGFKGLVSLNLSFNLLKSIPVGQGMTKLRDLNISYNQISSLENISDLNLEHLNASHQFDAANNPTLRQFDDEGDALLAATNGLQKKLKSLDLSGNYQIKNLDFLDDFAQLKSLNVRDTNVDSIKSLAGLKNLIYLDLSQTRVSDDDLSALEGLPLRSLLLSGNKSVVNGLSLTKMPHLTNLSLSGAAMESVENLAPLTKLRFLDVYGIAAAEDLRNSKPPSIEVLFASEPFKPSYIVPASRVFSCCVAAEESTASLERFLRSQ